MLNGAGGRPSDLRVQPHPNSVTLHQEKVQIYKGQAGVLARKYIFIGFSGSALAR